MFKDKSVWSWKLAWMSALLCPLNFASSFIRDSHHQYVFFFSLFPSFIRLNETHSSSFSIFSRLFLLFFMCVCVTMPLPDDCQRGHMARNTCADNAKKKLIQEQQETWFFLVYLFCSLNRDRSRLNQEKNCWFSGPVQMANLQEDEWLSWLSNYSTQNYHDNNNKKMCWLTHTC